MDARLGIANQRLLKVLNDLDAADAVIGAQKDQITALEQSLKLSEEIELKRQIIIELQDKELIELRRKQRPQLSLFFGLIKARF